MTDSEAVRLEDSENQSNEMIIDVVKPSDEHVDSHDFELPPPPPTKPSSSLKKKPIEKVFVDGVALGQLNSLAVGRSPIIGVLHGAISDQGAALIKRVSELPRDVNGLCKWRLCPGIELDYQDGIGFFASHSETVDIDIDISLWPAILKRDEIIYLSIRKDEDECPLSVGIDCSLISSSIASKVKDLPVYKSIAMQSENETLLKQTNFNTELNQAIEVLSNMNVPISYTQARSAQIQGQEHDRFYDKVSQSVFSQRFDRLLLELRKNVNSRIQDLEKNWNSKRPKIDETTDENHGHKKDSLRFRSFVQQLVIKEFQETSKSMEAYQSTTSPITSILSKHTKPHTNGTASKKKTSGSTKSKTGETKKS